MKGQWSMMKLKAKMKNLALGTCFLFRPMTPIAVSFVCLVIAVVLLVFILFNLEPDTKVYEVLLAILTGVTASLLIAIMIELYSNYRFNVKRQRELRAYFRLVASYEMNIDSVRRTEANHCSSLGAGRAYALFCQLYKIIPCIREALDHRDYLYLDEVEAIDDVLLEYDDLVKVLWAGLLNTFMGLMGDRAECNIGRKTDQPITSADQESDVEPESSGDGLVFESIRDYPSLLDFLEQEAKRYRKKEEGLSFDEGAPDELETILEKAIFVDRQVFSGYFEVTDSRYDSIKNEDPEEELDEKPMDRVKMFEFRSNMISLACGDIDKAMMKLQRRAAKEPHFWVMASYPGKNR